ncbi:MAG: sugar phosphate isomerase/epimerase [Bacteroidales bacterium]|nr:sugar phosphate isomerase/epimerase [Bacteroidales bacterium]
MYISRRKFIRKGSVLTAGIAVIPSPLRYGSNQHPSNPIRLGAPVPGKFSDPADWIKTIRSLGYSAAYCPVQPGAPSELIKAFRSAAGKNNILIAEVGAWSNMMDTDETVRKEAVGKNIDALQLADEIGAICCVNISGGRGEIWDGPYPGNYAADTFDMIVETARYIIDQVKPAAAYYTLEPMPYMLPDSPDTYLELIRAVGRKQFAAHLDPVNMISSPQKFFNNAAFLRECFDKLGPYIKSIHAKDITILPRLTVHLEERRPGLGSLDYTVFLREAGKLKDVPFMLEHLDSQEEYRLAADYVRETGLKAGITFV